MRVIGNARQRGRPVFRGRLCRENTASSEYSTLDMDLDCDHRDSKDHENSDCKQI